MTAEDPQPPPDDPLDALLAAARWPEPSPEASRRLRAAWAACSPARAAKPRRSRRLGGAAVAAAAAVLVAASALPLVVRPPTPRVAVPTPEPVAGRPLPLAPAGSSPGAETGTSADHPISPRRPIPADSSVPAVVSVPSRPANLAERWALLSSASRGPAATRPTAAATADRPVASARAPAGPSGLAGTTRRRPGGTNHTAGAVVNGGGPILRTAASPDARRRLATLAAAAGPDDRRAVVGRWLAAAGPADLDAFLAAVLTGGWRDDALAAWRHRPDPPVDRLFARLAEDPLVDRRFAAARVLGSAPGDAVRAELERRVLENANRREAVAALLSAGDGRADRFLSAAARADRSLESQVGLVRLDLRRLF